MFKKSLLTLVSGLLLFSGLVHTQAQTNCPNTPRLQVGHMARVLPGDPNNVRTQSFRESVVVTQIPGGEQFAVLEGPVCDSSYIWWRINYKGTEGWTVEGNASEYWAEPLNPDVTITPTLTPSLTPVPPTLAPTLTPSQTPIPPTLAPTLTLTKIPTLDNPFLSADMPVSNIIENGATVFTNTTEGDLVVMRDTPSRSGEEIFKFENNARLRVTDDASETDGLRWWHVESPEGHKGWIAEGILEGRKFQPLLVPACTADDNSIALVMFDEVLDASNLYTMNPDTGDLCNLTYNTTSRTLESIDMSPDGQQITFRDDSNVYVIGAEGGPIRLLASFGILSDMEWSPDSKHIAMVRTTSDAQENSQVWVINVEDGNPAALTEGNIVREQVEWASENRVYYIEPDTDPTSKLRFIPAINIDLGYPGLVYHGDLTSDTEMQVSPDGRQIALQIDGNVSLANVTTSRATVISENQDPQVMLWSPDGNMIAVIFHESETISLFNAEGEAQESIELEEGSASDMRWSPDGESMLIRLSDRQLYLYDLESGTGQTLIDGKLVTGFDWR